MTDTKEFNKSLDRIAKALGGEEWSPEDKPEAMYKLLDKIADKLEEKSDDGGSDETLEALIVEMTMSEDAGGQQTFTLNKTWKEISDAMLAGITVLIHNETSYGYSYAPVIKLDHIEFGSDNTYNVSFWDSVTTQTLETDTQNGYPSGTGN